MMSHKRHYDQSSSCSPDMHKKLKMSSSCETECSSEFVIMPWDDKTEIIMSMGDNTTNVCTRWELIQKQLHPSTLITSEDDLIKVIKSYNVVYEKDGKQSKSPWKCLVLRQYFAHLDEYNKNKFFQENGILSTIRNLSLQLRELIPKLKILKMGHASSIRLHQVQIASILANAFLCTFPRGQADCPSINFNKLYESTSTSVLKNCIEKIKCIMHYFSRIHTKQPTGSLSFQRLCIPDYKFPRWDKTNVNLCSLKVDAEGRIEDQAGYLQMDFANRYVGGGVLGRGCVQEEIRFIVCPELIAARLFTESLADNESLFVIGAERYCQYTGYANTFKFAADFQDSTPFDEDGRRKTYLIVLDALYFHHSFEQYRESKILRELKKAYVGFKPVDESNILPLATGNWGCGAFGGDPQLKSILQLMASSQAKRDMLYLTFGNTTLKNQIQELYQLLKEKAANVGMLYRIIRLYNREKRKNETVFEFIKESFSKFDKRKLPQPSHLSENLESALNNELIKREAVRSKHNIAKLTYTEKQKLPKETDEFSHELDIDFKALDREVQNLTPMSESRFPTNTKKVFHKSSALSARELESGFSAEHSSILDIIWFENEVDYSGNTKKKSESHEINEKDTRNAEVSMDSPSLFSDDEEIMCEKPNNNFQPGSEETFESGFSKIKHLQEDMENVENTESRKSVSIAKKLVQTKITDLFKK